MVLWCVRAAAPDVSVGAQVTGLAIARCTCAFVREKEPPAVCVRFGGGGRLPALPMARRSDSNSAALAVEKALAPRAVYSASVRQDSSGASVRSRSI